MMCDYAPIIRLLPFMFIAVAASAGDFFIFQGPSAVATYANAINSDGQIIGRYLPKDNPRTYSGYLRQLDGSIEVIAPTGSTFTNPTGINNRGVVTGTWNQGQTSHGFVRQTDGTIETFDVPGSTSITAAHINSLGTIAGTCVIGLNSHGFVRDRLGHITTIDAPGSSSTSIAGINDTGHIAGTYFDLSLQQYQGFLYDPAGKFTSFNAPGANAGTGVSGLNASGEITGTASFSGKIEGFIRYAGGAFVVFAVGQSGFTEPLGISDAGTVTGSAVFSDITVGFVRYGDGTLDQFQVPGSSIDGPGTTPQALNESGFITGQFSTARNDTIKAFIYRSSEK